MAPTVNQLCSILNPKIVGLTKYTSVFVVPNNGDLW